jgi:hypothetical protein
LAYKYHAGAFMQYKITKQYGRGSEIQFAQFNELSDAQVFIEKIKLPEDVALNVKIIYRIFEGLDLVKEYDPSKMDTSSGSSSQGASESQGSGGGKGSKSTFSPTPFNTAPRPAGTPQKWVIDKDEEDKDKKE